jgi:hypothetical protein
MTFIGETNYCALVLDDSSFQNLDKSTLFCMKPLTELYSDVVALVIRITVQLDQLGFIFQKKENTRIIQPGIGFHFYLHKNNFYIAMTGSTCLSREKLIADILHDVVQDILRPLHTRIEFCESAKNYLEYTETDTVFEVEEYEEPLYKKRRTISI